MQIQCKCGNVQGEIRNFPKETPGRLGCYCDDCQIYLMHLERTDLLDEAGCTELVPVYPANLVLTAGQEQLRCVRLTGKGLFRWYTACCGSPVANTMPNTPWVGLSAHLFRQKDATALERALGPVRSRIMGAFAKGTPAPGTAKRMDVRSGLAVGPFFLKGKLLGKSRPSPFFKDDGETPVVPPVVLSVEELEALRKRFELQGRYQGV